MSIIQQTVFTAGSAQLAGTIPASGSSLDGQLVTPLGATANINLANGSSVTNITIYWVPSASAGSPTAAMAIQNATPTQPGGAVEFNGLLMAPGDQIWVNPGTSALVAGTLSATPR